ncbi:MAG TPA: LysM peptidoglycan-binding domain-containing protein [Candidatus Saccharimonadales bacterium]|jgi:LysM repeat protein
MIEEKRALIGFRLQKSLKRKSVRKRLIRYGLVAANAGVLAAVIFFVASGSHAGTVATTGALSDSAAANPVDGLTSYDIAANVARMTNLPESIAINNQAQSAQATVAASISDTSVVSKPQIVATALKSRDDIQSYIAQPGDTVVSIAQKFGVTSDSIKWSNSLTTATVALGAKLVIPPVNGIVYTVKSGDTIQGLAARFSASVDQITAYNDAEIAGISPGEQIIIPNGQIQVAAVSSFSSGFLGGSFTPIYGSNGYDPGWCTYYAAAIAHVPSNWGNATTWAYYARLSGWTVSTTPVVGAVVQTSRGDHVGIVNQISADGSQITYSDMNGLAGFNRVGTSGWVSAVNGFDGGRYNDVVYIYR